jgi:hypothetical protein
VSVIRRFKADDNDWQLSKCTTDSLYTISALDANIDYSHYTPEASKLFRMESKYFSPKDLNYKLPSDRIPEFAFVGRWCKYVFVFG